MEYIENFITDEQESLLIEQIDQQQFSNELKRRTIQYGKRYSYQDKLLHDTNDIPDFLKDVVEKINEKYNKNFNQIIINEYLPGQCITKHIDNIRFFGNTIVVLSLLSDTHMTFSKQYVESDVVKLERCSLLALTGEMRYKYCHEIKAKHIKSRRLSITFRELI